MNGLRILTSGLAAVALTVGAVLPVLAQDEEPAAEVAGVVDSVLCMDGMQTAIVTGDDVLQHGGIWRESDGDIDVSVVQTNADGPLRFFDFIANQGVNAVVVTGPQTLRFEFNPPVLGATELHGGATFEGLAQDVEVIRFCY